MRRTRNLESSGRINPCVWILAMNVKLIRVVRYLLATALVILSLGTIESKAQMRAPIRDEQHIASRRVWSWQEIQRRNIVMQSTDYSCGAAALATVVKYQLGDNVTEKYFLKALDNLLTPKEIEDRVENGLAMSDLRRVAVKTGYEAVVAELTFEKLSESKVPLIVGIDVDDNKHFVVYRGTDFQRVYLADPIRGNIRVPIPKFLCEWQENMALAVAKPGQKIRTQSPLSLTAADLFLGQTNDQYLRTLPQRDSVHESIPVRR